MDAEVAIIAASSADGVASHWLSPVIGYGITESNPLQVPCSARAPSRPGRP